MPKINIFGIVGVPQLLQQLFGKVLGDQGDVSQTLALELWQNSGSLKKARPLTLDAVFFD